MRELDCITHPLAQRYIFLWSLCYDKVVCCDWFFFLYLHPLGSVQHRIYGSQCAFSKSLVAAATTRGLGLFSVFVVVV
jgi:hypothetical protein